MFFNVFDIQLALVIDGIDVNEHASFSGECMWIHLKLIKEMKTFCKDLFPVSSYGIISIPSYPCGTIGFMMCSKSSRTNFKEPLRIFTEEEKENLNLQYYDENVHRGAFVLPRFVKKVSTYQKCPIKTSCNVF